MKKLTQSQIILNVLKDRNDWVPSYHLIKIETAWGWLGTSADREARRMAEDGIIERKRDGKYSYYSLKVGKELTLDEQYELFEPKVR